MSVFDPETFLSSSTTASNETTFTSVPEGEYDAYIDDVKARTVRNREGNEVPVLDVVLLIPDEEVKSLLALERVTVTDSIFVDFDSNGAIATGTNKNLRLGQLRDAVGQNKSGKEWMPLMLKGTGPVKIKIVQGKPDEQTGVRYPRVQRYAKA